MSLKLVASRRRYALAYPHSVGHRERLATMLLRRRILASPARIFLLFQLQARQVRNTHRYDWLTREAGRPQRI